MSVTQLARPEIVAFQAYVTAEQQPDTLRLNANESPYPPPRTGGALNRYPRIRPDTLEARLSSLYGVPATNLLVTRGSSEAIDILIRTFCRAYRDGIVTTPPTFSMYKVYADMQAAAVAEIPLADDERFSLDTNALLDGCTDNSKLIFLCSPNNPTGTVIDHDDVLALAAARAGKSLVVVDEAYIEFSEMPSLASAAIDSDNLVVLRTLSKASGLAGARCGAVIASAETIRLLAKMLPPYAFSTPSTECLLEALDADANGAAETRIANAVSERTRMFAALQKLDGVEKIWRSHGNFLLVRFTDLPRVGAAVNEAGILIRLFDGYPALRNCARISIGTAAENDALLAALRKRS